MKTHVITTKLPRFDRTGRLVMQDIEDLEVEYKDSGEIVGIKLYSDFFVDWIPVPMSWLETQWPGRFQDLQDEIDDKIEVDNFHFGKKQFG